MLEVFGLATAFAAADAGCKAGNVRLENFDKNKPANADELPVPLIVMVKFRGQVADVEAALEAATAKAESMTGIVTKYKISRPTEDTEKMLKLNAFDKGTPHKVTDEEGTACIRNGRNKRTYSSNRGCRCNDKSSRGYTCRNREDRIRTCNSYGSWRCWSC